MTVAESNDKDEMKPMVNIVEATARKIEHDFLRYIHQKNVQDIQNVSKREIDKKNTENTTGSDLNVQQSLFSRSLESDGKKQQEPARNDTIIMDKTLQLQVLKQKLDEIEMKYAMADAGRIKAEWEKCNLETVSNRRIASLQMQVKIAKINVAMANQKHLMAEKKLQSKLREVESTHRKAQRACIDASFDPFENGIFCTDEDKETFWA